MAYGKKTIAIILAVFVLPVSYLSAVEITPGQITFDCADEQLQEEGLELAILSNEASAWVRSNRPVVPTRVFEFAPPAQKVLDEQRILDLIAQDGEADVIITFDYTLTEGLPDLESLPDRISYLHEGLMTEPNMAQVAVQKLYENIPIASMRINAADLAFLRSCQWVAGIEPLMFFETTTAQGIPLMDGDFYRAEHSGNGVSIAILDTGIDYTHPAFGGGGFPNSKVIGGYDYGNNDSNPIPSGHSHGSSVAGIAAGDITNHPSYPDYIGGVAYGAKLYALKITPDGSGSTDTGKMTSAINWCITNQYADPDNPILVINISMGGGRYTGTCDSSSSALTNAVNSATAAGIAVLSSSGNDGYCDAMGIPACVSNVISVGAVFDAAIGYVGFTLAPESCIYTGSTYFVTAEADMVAQYSNSSNLLDLLAPSHRATTPTNTSYTTSFGGTSAASPYAAGAVAVLQSRVAAISETFLTVQEVKNILTQQGDPIEDWKNNITKPRVSIANAVEYTSFYGGEQITVYNTKNFSGTIDTITSPDWVTTYPEPPITIPGKQSVTIYATADCSECNYEQLAGIINISGSRFPSGFSGDMPVTLGCPPCEYSASLTDNCEVGLLDFAILADCWLSSDSGCDIANIDGSFPVDTGDLEIMADQWLGGK